MTFRISGGIMAAALLLPFGSAAPAQTSGAALPTVTTEAAPLPVTVAPSGPLIRYEGRFDRTDPAGPRCSWSASAVHLSRQETKGNIVAIRAV